MLIGSVSMQDIYADMTCLRNPIGIGDRDKEVLKEIKKEEIKARLTRLEGIITRKPEDITQDEFDFIFETAKHFNLWPDFFTKFVYNGKVEPIKTKKIESLCILSKAELKSLDYKEIPVSIMFDLEHITNGYFSHDLNHIYDEVASSDFSSIVHGKYGSINIHKNDYDREVNSLHSWQFILDQWYGIFDLKPEIISALMDEFTLYLEETLNKKKDAKRILSENEDKIPNEVLDNTYQAIKRAEGYCKFALMDVRGANEGLTERDEKVDIAGSIKLFQQAWTETRDDIDIKLELEGEAVIYGNQKSIDYIWRTLFYNATESIREILKEKKIEKGVINVKIKRDKDFIEIEVSDNGKGISEEALKDRNLFKKKFTTKKEGTGLGLYLIEQVIKERNGTIEASNNEQGGAVFTITLPVMDAQENKLSMRNEAPADEPLDKRVISVASPTDI